MLFKIIQYYIRIPNCYLFWLDRSCLGIPFMYRFTISCFPNACSFILFNKDYRPDGTVATDEKSTLDLHILTENAMASAKSGEAGLICFSLQNTCHCLIYLPCLLLSLVFDF